MRILQIYFQNKQHGHKPQCGVEATLHQIISPNNVDTIILCHTFIRLRFLNRIFFTSCVIGYIVKITNLQIYLRNVAITHVKFNKIVVINFCASRNRCTDKFILLLQMCVECHGLPNGISVKL